MSKSAKQLTISERLRNAKQSLNKSKTYENAVEVQRLERQLRDWRKENIKVVYKGDS